MRIHFTLSHIPLIDPSPRVELPDLLNRSGYSYMSKVMKNRIYLTKLPNTAKMVHIYALMQYTINFDCTFKMVGSSSFGFCFETGMAPSNAYFLGPVRKSLEYDIFYYNTLTTYIKKKKKKEDFSFTKV